MTPQECRDSLREAGIPGHLHGGLIRYVLDGIRPGSFLSACIACEGEEAMLRAADENTKRSIPLITTWLLTECPMDCAGSSARMEKWISDKTIERLKASKARS